MDDSGDMHERFLACMVLAGVGDALGYRNGDWEFNPSGVTILHEADRMGGVEHIRLDGREWKVSDDTVMHIATAEALVEGHGKDHETLLHTMADKYIQCMSDMDGRAPGLTCKSSVRMLAPNEPQGYQIPFNSRGGGCGAAMRAAPIGLYYWRPEQIDSLVEVAIESGRMTHNHPTGYLGSLATALFVSYAVQKKPLREWGAGLMQILQMAKEYVMSSGRDLEANLQNWSYFETQWKNYLQRRKLKDGKTEPHIDYRSFSAKARDAFYEELSFDGTGGASGHDAPMIAYEALLLSWKFTDPSNKDEKRRQWIELCKCSMLHGGDSDSTGIIAGACWGAMEGFVGVPRNHYQKIEYHTRLEALGHDLFQKAYENIESLSLVPALRPSLQRITREVIWVDPDISNSENSGLVQELKETLGICLFATASAPEAVEALKKKKEGTQYRAITSGSGGEEFVRRLRRELSIMCKVLVFCMSVDYHKTWARKYGNVEVTDSTQKMKTFATFKD